MAESIRARVPCVLLFLQLAAMPAAASRPDAPPPSAVTTGTVDLYALAGGSLHGPGIGLKARFRNGFEAGFRHSRWQAGHAEEAGIYFLPARFLARARRPYFGTEIFRSNGDAYGMMDFSGARAASRTARAPERKPALLLVAGQEHRVGSRWAVSYEAAGGARMTRAYAGPLPPLLVQGRAQMLFRVF